MDTKQIKALEWMDSLGNYAREKQLSMRIIDGLEECKSKVKSDTVDWMEVNHKVEDLLSSIEQKTVPTASLKSNEEQVSLKSVEEQVRKMAQRCQTENRASIENITERKNLTVKMAYDNLREITHTKAHLEELKNQSAYKNYFEKEKSEYEKNAFQMLRELLQDINSNYDHLLDHIKSMLSSIGGHKLGVGNEKIYYEYETKREGINSRFLNEISSSDIGGSKIVDLGLKTSEPVKVIVKKFIRKRKFLAWAPLLIICMGLMIGSAVTRENNIKVIEESQSQITDSEDDEQSTWLSDMAKQAGKKAIKNASSSAIANALASFLSFLSALLIALGSVLLAIVLLIIVLYVTYLRFIKTWCDRRICVECEKYLQIELDMFIQNNPITPVLDETIKTSVREYEEEYLVILNQIFSGNGLDAANEEQTELDYFYGLKESWNKIKYE